MHIQYRGTITKQDFLKCARMLNPMRWQKWFIGTLLVFVAFCFIYLWLEGSRGAIQPVLDMGPTSLIPLVFMLFPWWTPYLQSASYNQKTNIYRSEVFGTIDDQEVMISNGEVRASFRWSAFTAYKMGKDLLLLRQGKYGFNAFKPDMFSTAHDWEDFVAIVKSRISAR